MSNNNNYGRPVEVFKWVWAAGIRKNVKEYECSGAFLQFGSDAIEYDTGAASYSVGIVELPDGSLRSVPVELLRFSDKEVKG